MKKNFKPFYKYGKSVVNKLLSLAPSKIGVLTTFSRTPYLTTKKPLSLALVSLSLNHALPSRKEHANASFTALNSKARETCFIQVKLSRRLNQ